MIIWPLAWETIILWFYLFFFIRFLRPLSLSNTWAVCGTGRSYFFVPCGFRILLYESNWNDIISTSLCYNMGLWPCLDANVWWYELQLRDLAWIWGDYWDPPQGFHFDNRILLSGAVQLCLWPPVWWHVHLVDWSVILPFIKRSRCCGLSRG